MFLFCVVLIFPQVSFFQSKCDVSPLDDALTMADVVLRTSWKMVLFSMQMFFCMPRVFYAVCYYNNYRPNAIGETADEIITFCYTQCTQYAGLYNDVHVLIPLDDVIIIIIIII